MSREYASLVAQVIPVFALALGLEMRTFVDRFVKRAAQTRALGQPIEKVASGTVVAFSSLATIQMLLAGAEVRALAVVADSQRFWSNVTLPAAVFLVVMIPILTNVYAMIQATEVIGRGKRWSPVLGAVAGAGVAIALLSYVAFGQ